MRVLDPQSYLEKMIQYVIEAAQRSSDGARPVMEVLICNRPRGQDSTNHQAMADAIAAMITERGLVASLGLREEPETKFNEYSTYENGHTTVVWQRHEEKKHAPSNPFASK